MDCGVLLRGWRVSGYRDEEGGYGCLDGGEDERE